MLGYLTQTQQFLATIVLKISELNLEAVRSLYQLDMQQYVY